MRKVPYAVIGLGNISQVAVLPAFAHAKENSELVALISGDEKKRRVLARRYKVKGVGGYDDLESILEEHRVEAAYLGVPNSEHRALTERIARMGVHVLCEKPMAMTEEDCRAMIAAARQGDVKLMIAYRLHFDEANLKTIELIRSPRFGDPRLFSTVFTHQVRPGDIRTREELGGGGLFDLGVYCVNASRYLFGDEPTEVLGAQIRGHDPRFEEVDEVTSAMMLFPNDRIAQFTVSQGTAAVSSYQVVGTKGDVLLEGAYEYAMGMKQYVTLNGKTKQRSFRKHDQFAAELVYFSRCILQDKDPEPSGEEGLADVRIMEAITESARTGRRVPIAPIPRKMRPRSDQGMTKPPVDKPETVHAPSPSLD